LSSNYSARPLSRLRHIPPERAWHSGLTVPGASCVAARPPGGKSSSAQECRTGPHRAAADSSRYSSAVLPALGRSLHFLSEAIFVAVFTPKSARSRSAEAPRRPITSLLAHRFLHHLNDSSSRSPFGSPRAWSVPLPLPRADPFDLGDLSAVIAVVYFPRRTTPLIRIAHPTSAFRV